MQAAAEPAARAGAKASPDKHDAAVKMRRSPSAATRREASEELRETSPVGHRRGRKAAPEAANEAAPPVDEAAPVEPQAEAHHDEE